MSVREAVIMAAGVGRRLKPFTDTRHKALFEVGGRSLLQRHLDHLAAGGVERTTLVVGYRGEQIREHGGARHGAMTIRYVENPEYRRGSILSFRAGLGGLNRDAVFMDGDVLYQAEVLHRLLRSEEPLCCLLDATAAETGEEMMLGVRAGRVHKIARRAGPGWDQVGESVGFFKVGASGLPRLSAILDEFVGRGAVDVEYEEALRALMAEAPFGLVEIGDLPWTEIDFEEDLVKAERVLARLRELGAER